MPPPSPLLALPSNPDPVPLVPRGFQHPDPSTHNSSSVLSYMAGSSSTFRSSLNAAPLEDTFLSFPVTAQLFIQFISFVGMEMHLYICCLYP